MNRTAARTVLGCLVTLALASGAAAEEEQGETCNALFVHSARSITMDASTLTMEGVSPTVIYFCDRPIRLAGHLGVQEFLDSVSKGEDSFAADPPNAAVSIMVGDEVVDLVVTLHQRPTVDGDKMVYSGIEILDGELPQTAGAGSIFIDVIGRPMSPGSIAGVHRRHRRRAIRRCAAGVTCW